MEFVSINHKHKSKKQERSMSFAQGPALPPVPEHDPRADEDDASLKRLASAADGTASLTNDESRLDASLDGGRNIWHRLLRKDSLWDSLNVIPSDGALPSEIFYEKSSAPSALGVACRTALYEVSKRHRFVGSLRPSRCSRRVFL